MLTAPQLILTRPQQDSAALAAILAQEGIASICCPMLAIEPNPSAAAELAAIAQQPLECVLITSRHSIAALPAPLSLSTMPVFAVGEATARAAFKQGWTGQAAIAPNFAALIPLLQNHPYSGKIALYLRAEAVSATPQEHLPQWTWHSIISYRAQQQTALTPELLHAISSSDTPLYVALFSARSAQAFEAAQPAAPRAPLRALCLSKNVASALTRPDCWQSKQVAHSETQDAMLTLIRQQLTNAHQ